MMHLNAKFTDVTRVHVQIRRLRAICREDLLPVFMTNSTSPLQQNKLDKAELA